MARRSGSDPPRRESARGGGDAVLWAVALLALLVNAPVVGVPLVLDDHVLVERDARVQGAQIGEIWSTSYWAIGEETAEYRPLALTTYAVERRALGAAPWHFHLVNLFLHALVSAAVLLAGRAVGLGEQAATVGAIVFAVHPVHLDALAPVVGRSELLAALAYVVPVWLWVRIRRAPSPPAGALAALAGVVALGAFAKENALAVLPLLALVELVLLRGSGARSTLAAASAAAALPSLASLAARMVVLGGLLPEPGSGTIVEIENPLVDEPLGVRLLTSASLLGTYLRLFVWPAWLSPDYSYDSLPVIGDPLDPAVWAPLALLAAGISLALLRLRDRPRIAIAIGAFLAPYAVVSNALFPIGTMLAERLLYLPSVGLCWGTGLAAVSAARRFAPRLLASPAAAGLALAVPVGALGIASYERAEDWQDEAGLYREAAEHYPRNFVLRRNLGSLAMEAGRYEEALYHFRRVNELVPGYAKAWGDRGFLELATGDPEAAVDALERSVELDSSAPTPLRNLAAAYRATGRYREAARIEERIRLLSETAAGAGGG